MTLPDQNGILFLSAEILLNIKKCKFHLRKEINENKNEIRKVIRQEINSGLDVCFTGKVTRLVNALTGFIDDVQIGYSENEQINNAVIAIMRRHENDSTINVKEEIKKMLDELIGGVTSQLRLNGECAGCDSGAFAGFHG